MTGPLFVEPLIGFRSWTVTNRYDLAARITQERWPNDRKAVAGCFPRRYMREKTNVILAEPHESPDVRCECGLYAFHDLYDAIDQYGEGERAVIGAAVFWGHIEVFTAGFRAQYGRIVALTNHRRRKDLAFPSRLNATAHQYKIPVVPLSLLRSYAETFGKSLGADSLSD
jgi:hypothetical protein